MKELKTVSLLSLPVAVCRSRKELMNFVYESAFKHLPLKIGFLDSETFVSAFFRKKIRDVLRTFDFFVPSSVGVIWALRFLKGVKSQRIPQLRFFLDVAELCDRENFTLFVLSKSERVAREAGEVLKGLFKNLKIVGFGSYSKENEKKVLIAVRKSNPHFLVVDMNSPGGERWIHRHFDEFFPNSIAVSVKDAVRLQAGKKKVAPIWMQEKGFEWLYRIIRNPFNIVKIFKLALFPLLVLWIKVLHRGGK